MFIPAKIKVDNSIEEQQFDLEHIDATDNEVTIIGSNDLDYQIKIRIKKEDFDRLIQHYYNVSR